MEMMSQKSLNKELKVSNTVMMLEFVYENRDCKEFSFQVWFIITM